MKKTKEKTGAKRETLRDKRKDLRGKLRKGAAAASCLLLALVVVGCASATPSSKSQQSKACGNVITVNLNVTVATNAVAAALPPGGVTITLSDLIGTQVQSADTGNDETVSQTATPTNQNGLTGDKPIEAVADVAQAGLSMGGTSALKAAAKAAGITPTGQPAAATAADCVGEACSDTPK